MRCIAKERPRQQEAGERTDAAPTPTMTRSLANKARCMLCVRIHVVPSTTCHRAAPKSAQGTHLAACIAPLPPVGTGRVNRRSNPSARSAWGYLCERGAGPWRSRRSIRKRRCILIRCASSARRWLKQEWPALVEDSLTGETRAPDDAVAMLEFDGVPFEIEVNAG